MNWILNRLGEHSTQVALGGAVATLGTALQGQMSWSTALPLLIGTAVTAVIPASSPPSK